MSLLIGKSKTKVNVYDKNESTGDSTGNVAILNLSILVDGKRDAKGNEWLAVTGQRFRGTIKDNRFHGSLFTGDTASRYLLQSDYATFQQTHLSSS